MAANYYDILGLQKSASPDDIRRAYRKLASEHHPDRGGNAEKFKEINEAYQVLSDQNKRQQYDQYGQTFEQAQRQGGGFNGNPFGGNPFGAGNPFGGANGPFGGFDFSQGSAEFDFGDIFTDIFGGAAQRQERRNNGVDLEMPLTITFEESIFGAEKEISLEKKNACSRCKGTGAEQGAKVVTCPKCHGQGQIKTQRRTILGTISSATVCDRCDGTGKVPEVPCSKCNGSGLERSQTTIKIKIPAGIAEGQRIHIRGAGEAGYRGSTSGDLYVLIRVKPDQEFRREGFNLFKNIVVSFPQAALGDNVEVKTMDGTVKLKIPAGTQPNKVFKLSGKGVPHLNRSGRGDLFVTVNVHVPEKLSKRQKELLKELDKKD